MTSEGAHGITPAKGDRGDAPPGAPGFRSVTAGDATAQAAHQAWVPMECYQLTDGNRVAQLDILDLGSRQLVRERQAAAVQKLGATPKGLCTLSLSRTPAVRFSEIRENDPELVFFLPEATEFDVHVPPGVETVYVSLNQDEFLDAARILDPQGWERAPNELTMRHTHGKAAVWEAVDRWFRMAAGETGFEPRNDLLQPVLFDAIIQVAAASPLDSAAVSSVATRGRAMHIGRAARDFITDKLDGDRLPTIVETCRELGVSERTLQYAFFDYAGLSPTAYLRRVRLNRVRAALREADAQTATVTETAMRFGFLHLGRFACDYKMLFGESPSATLAS